jgi:uncharacterized protein (UPF0128 family)
MSNIESILVKEYIVVNKSKKTESNCWSFEGAEREFIKQVKENPSDDIKLYAEVDMDM